MTITILMVIYQPGTLAEMCDTTRQWLDGFSQRSFIRCSVCNRIVTRVFDAFPTRTRTGCPLYPRNDCWNQDGYYYSKTARSECKEDIRSLL